jgi:hypothetical protein
MEITYSLYLIVLPLIFLAGLVDSIAGGGGLISLPAYLIAGLPPHNALANNKMSSSLGTLYSTIRYFRHGMIDIRVAIISAIFALVGSYMGTQTVLGIDMDYLNRLLLILLPIICIFTYLKRDMGMKNTSDDIPFMKKYILAMISGLVIGFYDGFFGPGAGSFLILIFTVLLKYDFTVANGNTKVVNLASNIAALVAFISSGKVIFAIGIPAAIVGILGNHVGSKLVIKRGNAFIKPIFLSVFVLLFIKIIMLWL